MTFPLPFSPGMFVPTKSAPSTDELKKSLDNRRTVILPEVPFSQIPFMTATTPSSASTSTTTKLSEADIDRMLASLKPAGIKKTRKPDPDPPGTKYPYVTQFCANGGHEDKPVLSFRGTLMVTCRGLYDMYPRSVTCTCWCHTNAAIKKTLGKPAAFLPVTDTQTSAATVTEAPRPVETPVTEPEDVGFNPDEGPLDRLLNNKAMPLGPRVRNLVLKYLGREVTEEMLKETYVVRRRGELDSNVEAICRIYLAKALPWSLLTTDVIALLVDVDNPPSPGAIHAVLTRWEDQNFAITARDPFRFMCFTPTVDEIGIEAARSLAHRRARASERGFKL